MCLVCEREIICPKTTIYGAGQLGDMIGHLIKLKEIHDGRQGVMIHLISLLIFFLIRLILVCEVKELMVPYKRKLP